MRLFAVGEASRIVSGEQPEPSRSVEDLSTGGGVSKALSLTQRALRPVLALGKLALRDPQPEQRLKESRRDLAVGLFQRPREGGAQVVDLHEMAREHPSSIPPEDEPCLFLRERHVVLGVAGTDRVSFGTPFERGNAELANRVQHPKPRLRIDLLRSQKA